MGIVQNKDLKTRPRLWILFGTTSGLPALPPCEETEKVCGHLNMYSGIKVEARCAMFSSFFFKLMGSQASP